MNHARRLAPRLVQYMTHIRPQKKGFCIKLKVDTSTFVHMISTSTRQSFEWLMNHNCEIVAVIDCVSCEVNDRSEILALRAWSIWIITLKTLLLIHTQLARIAENGVIFKIPLVWLLLIQFFFAIVDWNLPPIPTLRCDKGRSPNLKKIKFGCIYWKFALFLF